MASEPAEPTTRQDDLIEKLLAAVIAADMAEYQPVGEDSDENWWRYIITEAVLPTVSGLLADPAQTTELEQLREQAANAFADTAKLHGMYARGGAMHLEIEPPHALVLAWVGAARAMLDDAPNYCETRVDAPKVEMEVKAAGELDRYACTIQRVGKVTPHEARRKAEAERDALSLLLRGMARKLVAYRKWADGDVPTVHKLRAELDGAHLTLDTMAGRLNQARAERDERQARIEAATAELKKWDALATRESEWMPCRAALAALVGDQGKHLGENQAELGGPKALTSGNSWANRDLDLSGAALRAVEEADDAAGEAP